MTTWSQHALERADEMNVDCNLVENVIANAAISYPNGKKNGGGTTYVGAGLAVPVNNGVIITVLWHGAERR